MAIKIKSGGQSVASMTVEKLEEAHARGGKSGHKARMELIKRGRLDGQGKNTFELVADSE